MVAALAELPSPGPLRGCHPVSRGPGRPTPAVYRHRRLVAAGVSIFFVAALIVVAVSALSRAGGGPLSVTGGGATPASSRVWVVRPGDTLWAIATTLQPGADVRPLVDRLSAEVGGATIYPGERVPVP
jgi:hypothetical protein